MKILAFDTSTTYLSLAVSSDENLLYEVNKEVKKTNHDQLLIPEMKGMLDKLRLKVSDIDVFCVGLGPGSFTGIRVGLSAGKGLSLACGKNILGISSMDAIAYNIESRDKLIACIKDARKEKVYGCLYRRGDELIRLTDYLLLRLDEFIDKVKKIKEKENKEVLFTADGVKFFKKRILEALPASYFAQELKWYPYARNLTKLSLEHIRKNRPFHSADEIEPHYLHSQYVNITKPKKL
jgi:tRNA threonylcarbamoyladenosine biosynthesis protein TsaB